MKSDDRNFGLETENTLLRFIDVLHESEVNYAVFKSIDSLHLSFSGHEDLDLVIDEHRIFDVLNLVNQFDGIVCNLHPSLNMGNRYDILLPDYEACIFYHIDLHTVIPMGLKFNKFAQYKFLSECEIAYNQEFGINTVTRSEELQLLITKLAIRKLYLWRTKLAVSKDDEIFNELSSCLNEIQNSSGILSINGINVKIDTGKNGYLFESVDLNNIRKRYKFTISNYRFYIYYIRHLRRKYNYLITRFSSSVLKLPVFDRRGPKSGGKVIAFIGVDGSGKSSIVKKTFENLKWKLSVKKIYLGSGDGDGWWFRRELTKLLVKGKKSSLGQNMTDKVRNRGKLSYKFAHILIGMYSLLIALERYQKVRAANLAAKHNFTILADRWPHHFDGGVLDGPINISTRSNNKITRIISKLEKYIYEKILSNSKTIKYIFLDTSYSDSQQRKPGELSENEYEKRKLIVKQMKNHIAPDSKCIISTADQLPEVEKKVFRAVWSWLR